MSFYQSRCLVMLLAMLAGFNRPSVAADSLPMSHLINLADDKLGIGARPAGSRQEDLAADYIQQSLEGYGLVAIRQRVKGRVNNKPIVSHNVFTTINGDSSQQVVIAAHFDSTGEKTGSLGATDNASGVAVLLSVAKILSEQPNLPLSLTLAFFGAEEFEMQGSTHYVNALSKQQKSNLVGMVNLDTVAGGDILYVHSAAAKPYDCEHPNRYAYDPILRDLLLAFHQADPQKTLGFQMHAENSKFPAGETGGWSDHKPFACQGIPVAYIEATNMSLLGKDGKDGYSQVADPAYWDCFSSQRQGSCEPGNEKKWGEIWHTQEDRIDAVERHFPLRIEQQMQANIRLIIGALTDPKSVTALLEAP